MKKLLILPALLALTVPLAGAGNQASGQTRPNVLFVAIDDLNDWIGPFGGHPQAKTPNLDLIVFHNFFAGHRELPASGSPACAWPVVKSPSNC